MQAHPHLQFYNGLTTFIMPRPQSKFQIPEFLATSIVSLHKDVHEEDRFFYIPMFVQVLLCLECFPSDSVKLTNNHKSVNTESLSLAW